MGRPALAGQKAMSHDAEHGAIAINDLVANARLGSDNAFRTSGQRSGIWRSAEVWFC